jgi:Lrp/AsnC family transcriptional regulator, leucine-responsive regulatory protein
MISSKPELDAFDLKILDQLQTEGRITNSELAARVGLSESPCFRRVRAMEEAGVIAGYRAHLDPSLLGLKIVAFIEVKVARHSGDAASRLRTLFQSDPHIVGCYMMTGGYDFLLKVVANDLESYKTDTVEKLLSSSDIQDIRTSIVLDLVKDTSSLPLARPARHAPAQRPKPRRPRR